MTNRKNETLGVKSLVTLATMSILSLTTAGNATSVAHAPLPVIGTAVLNHSMRNETLMPIIVEDKKGTAYDQAKELFVGKMRVFTESEAETYQKALEKIYKPTGVNIFDLC